MKKIAIMMTSLLFIPLVFFSSAVAEYTDGPENNEYNRTRAAQYIYNYSMTPNTAYFDFTNVGGDCTNFVSQVLAAGGMHMTYPALEPTLNDWYYYGSIWGHERSATWTNAHCFSYYWIDIDGIGAKKAYSYVKYCVTDLKNNSKWYEVFAYLEPGDIIQYVSPEDAITYHSQAVHRTCYENGEFKVSVGQHTVNGWRNLRNYISTLPENTIICFIKIKQPTSQDAGFMKSCSEKTVKELEDAEKYLFNMIPTDDTQEINKWSSLSAVKEELIKRAKNRAGVQEQKIPVSKEALISFISIRIENNNNLKNAIRYNHGLNELNIKTIRECSIENAELIGFLAETADTDRMDDGKLHMLWNKFWNNIIEQTPPSYYQ